MLSGFLAAFLSDKLQQRGVFTTGGCRKLFQLIGKLLAYSQNASTIYAWPVEIKKNILARLAIGFSPITDSR
jgi:hypothetical protein